MTIVDTFRNRLSEAMRLRGKKSADVARGTAMSSAKISQYMTGKIVNPKSDAIYAIAKYLNVSEAWLIGYDCPMKRVDNELPQEEKLKVALFGGDTEVTDEMWSEVKAFAEYVKAKHNK